MGMFGSDEGSDTPGFSADITSGSTPAATGGIDQELQDFLLLEKQKAEISAQIHDFNDLCWEMCLTGYPKLKLGGNTETCLNNCVDRFIDVSLFITKRFATSLQRGSNM